MDELQVEVCDVCGGAHSTELCPELGLDEADLANAVISRARLTLPYNIQAIDLQDGEVGVFAQEMLIRKSQFGPFEAKKTTHEFNDEGLFILKIFIKDGSSVSLDTTDENECNWLCLLRAATSSEEQNCMAYQLGTSVYYNTLRDIHPGEELKVWYAPQYARKLGKPVIADGSCKVMLGMKVIYTTVDEELTNSTIPPQDQLLEDEQNTSTTNEQEMAVDHDTNTTLDLMFKCKRCPMQFDVESEFARHIRDHLYPVPLKRGRKSKINFEKIENDKKVENFDRNENSRNSDFDEDNDASVDSDKNEDDEDDFVNIDSEEEFSPSNNPKEVTESPGRRVMPRRSLRGVRTTGFEEYVLMTKSVKKRKRLSSSLEEENSNINAIFETLDGKKKKILKTVEMDSSNLEENTQEKASDQKNQTKRGRGRPRKNVTKEIILDGEGTVDTEAQNNHVEEENSFIDGQERGSVLEEDFVKGSQIDSSKELEADDTAKGKSEDISLYMFIDKDGNSDETTEANENKEADVLEQKEGEATESFHVNSDETTEANGNKEADVLEQKEGEATESFDKESVSRMVDKLILNLRDEKEENRESANIDESLDDDRADTGIQVTDGDLSSCAGNQLDRMEEKHADKSCGTETENDNLANEMENEDEENTEGENQNAKRFRYRRKGMKRQFYSKKEKQLIPMIIRETENGREYVCSICSKKFTTERYLRLHAPAHTDQFKCKYCGSRYTRKDSLLKHECKISEFLLIENRETGDPEDGEPKKCVRCKKCEIEFESENDGKQHVLEAHSADPFFCEWCQKSFSTQKYYKIHKCEKKMEEEKPFPCDICSEAFINEKYLFRHMAMHTDIFKCKECGKRFSRKDSLQRHVLKCCPENVNEYDLFACNICQRTFSTAIGHQNHEVKCRKFRCFSCNKIYFSQENLDNHICPAVDVKISEVFLKHENAEENGIEEGSSQGDNSIEQTFLNLNSKEQTKLNLESVKKEIKKSKDVRFSCEQCKKSFRSLDYLFRHQRSHEGNFCCTLCKKVFKSAEELTYHTRYCKAAISIQDDGRVKCEKCDEEFVTVKEYREHFYTHTHPHQCRKCDKRFIKIGSLHTHACNSSSFDGYYSCEICVREFSSEKYLTRHMESHGEYKFYCDFCKKGFHRKDYFKTHVCKLPDGTMLRILDMNEEDYMRRLKKRLDKLVCHHCGKNFMSLSNLNKHLKIHGEKKCECPVCGKKFHQDEYLKMHIAGVHEKKFKYQCSECGKVLTSKPGLVNHMKQMHSTTKEVFPCPKCGKLFNQKGNLKTHMYSHTKEKLFTCTYCPKTFKYPDQLNRHNLMHTMENKLQCEHCDRKFVKGYELNKHYQVAHSGMMYVCEFCQARCSHRHTVIRHYKRKHPTQAELVKNVAYLNGIFKVVEKEEQYPEEQVTAIPMETQQIMIGDNVTIGDVLPQVAAEALHTLSTGGTSNMGIQTVQLTNEGHIINTEGTMLLPAGNDGTLSIQGVHQTIEGVDGQPTVVILQIMNPHEDGEGETTLLEGEVQIQELETAQIIETAQVVETMVDPETNIDPSVTEEIVTQYVESFGTQVT